MKNVEQHMFDTQHKHMKMYHVAMIHDPVESG